MFKTSKNHNSVKIVLDVTGASRLLGNNSVIPFLTAAEKRHFYPPKLPALRAEVDVLAQKSARLFSCLSAVASKIARFCLFGHLACACRKAAFLSAVRSALGAFRNAPARRRNIRYLGFRWARARLCPENRTQPPHAAHAGGQAFFCCACWNASNRFRMRSCSHSASSFASFCS